MPFSRSDRNQILEVLEVPAGCLSTLEACLRRTEEESEDLVNRAMGLVAKLLKADEALDEASTDEAGLLKAGELQYSEHKPCSIEKYKAKLRLRLARLIDYKLTSEVANIF
ncbi:MULTISPECIES: hypothetical protein [Cyanophyceae]|uniref:hypothetical protein n=1 Tax=Cyanophyceae TaxID=3028117 RepID=UPI00168644C9|nr:hypothetical protein [Trichocoleus sp. FACHB-40]MBD2005621.1 hypothetical protein [Trichocoleus sp. FACHB-40]